MAESQGIELEIIAVHGFLGKPSDWDFLRKKLNEAFPSKLRFRAVDVAEIQSATQGSMRSWAQEFNRTLTREPSRRRILLGYSMGGRLALHSIAEVPSLWDAAILVAPQTGLPESARPSRIEADEVWAKRFELEPWASLIESWEGLSVFGGRPSPLPRIEKTYDRTELAAILRNWSSGRQENLRPALVNWPRPLFWIAGEQDPKYAELGREITEERALFGHPSELWIAPDAAHRVPWDRPLEFTQHFCGFLDRVLLNRSPQ